jgi:hypothetical protein
MKTTKLKQTYTHKFIGFHNHEAVVTIYGVDKSACEIKCKELLLNYFHELSPNCTRLPLTCYNGVVAYAGVKDE